MYGYGEVLTDAERAANRAAFDAGSAAIRQAEVDYANRVLDVVEGKAPASVLRPAVALPDITVRSFPWWIPVFTVIGFLALGKSRGAGGSVWK